MNIFLFKIKKKFLFKKALAILLHNLKIFCAIKIYLRLKKCKLIIFIKFFLINYDKIIYFL